MLDGVGDNSSFAESLVKRLYEPHFEVLRLSRLLRDDVLKATNGAQELAFYASVAGDRKTIISVGSLRLRPATKRDEPASERRGILAKVGDWLAAAERR